jgi:small subunit ribosomal protein S7e
MNEGTDCERFTSPSFSPSTFDFVHPPTRLLATLYGTKNHRLTRELEKKLSDRYVVFVAQRRVLPKPKKGTKSTQKRPRSRTLTAVHEKILEDLVFPSEIVGKRTRVGVDGSKLIRA